jgi:hypothetical protein
MPSEDVDRSCFAPADRQVFEFEIEREDATYLGGFLRVAQSRSYDSLESVEVWAALERNGVCFRERQVRGETSQQVNLRQVGAVEEL